MEEKSIPCQKIRRKLAAKQFCDHQKLLHMFVIKNLKEASEWNLTELKEVYKVFHRFQKEGIMVGEIVRIKRGYGFTVRADIDQVEYQQSPQERLKVQSNFLIFLYKAAKEIERLKVWEEIY